MNRMKTMNLFESSALCGTEVVLHRMKNASHKNIVYLLLDIVGIWNGERSTCNDAFFNVLEKKASSDSTNTRNTRYEHRK